MISIANPLIGEEEKQAVMEVLASGLLAQGPKVKAFEEAFAEMCSTKYAVATSSGTTALHVALLAHGIGPGDEVITSPFTFIASANSVLYSGARPIFVDINPVSFNLDPAKIEAAITPNTKAIMPVHLFGLPCDMEAILAIAEKHNLAIIEDAAQSHGATYRDQRVGSFGTGCFSLYPTKNIASAEGGMVPTNSEEIAENSRVIRQHGMRRRYYHDELGFNFRLTDVHAAIGLAQLKKLWQFTEARVFNACFLTDHLEGVTTPTVSAGCSHVFHQYTIRVPGGRRDEVLAGLQEKGVGYEICYPVPVHQQRVYTELGYDVILLEAEQAATEVISLPVHPGLSMADLETIVAAVNELMR